MSRETEDVGAHGARSAVPTAELLDKFNRALVLYKQGLLERAQGAFVEILRTQPAHFNSLKLLGVIAAQRQKFQEAAQWFERAIAVYPREAQAHFNLALALDTLGRLEDAITAYGRALALNPAYGAAHFNRGNARARLGLFEEALEDYERALAIDPRSAAAHLNRGNALKELRRLPEALRSYERAIALDAAYAQAHQNRGNVLYDQRRLHEAIASYDQALALKPQLAECWFNRGNALRAAQRYAAAAESFDRAGALDPGIRFLAGDRCEVRMQNCDWRSFETDVAEIAAAIEGGAAACNPFCLLALLDDPALQRQAAQIWMREKCPPSPLAVIHPYARHERMRIGYFSADFRTHPVARQIAEVIELHDRARFEVTAVSYGPETDDPMRARLQRGFEGFVDVRARSDREIALLARRLELDIAVDLGGFTEEARPGIFAYRAAPLQVSYLGYLGTMGTDCIDYLIADRTLIPAESRAHYAEKIIHLPWWQANDSRRRIAEREFTRAELGLPTAAFVFCCFNACYKITPATFRGWMRILAATARGVLLLHADSASQADNLRLEAARCGIAPDRLVCAPRLPLPEYLARFRVADLFLDTLPYNAGTTASDALWAGLPVLTCIGRTFAGRVAASLLTALALPELITHSETEYENRAVQLASEPESLARIRQRLEERRHTARLFDTPAFTRHLEAAYTEIARRAQAGLPPEHIEVDA